MFIVTPHYFSEVGPETYKKKVFIFWRSSLTQHRDKFISIESPKQAFWLAPNVTNA